MKISVRLHINTKKENKNGEHPIYLRFIINRVVKRKTLAHCKEEDWDLKKNRIKTRVKDSDRINTYLSDELAKAEREIYDIHEGKKSIPDIFNKQKCITLNDAMNLELIRMEKAFKSAYYDKIKAIQRQTKNKDVEINKIDKAWFQNMISEMEENGNQGSTIMRKVKLIRGLISRYSEIGVTRQIKEIRVNQEKTIKHKLTTEELDKLAALNLPADDLLTATRDLFLLQVYLRGVRVGDILQANSDQFTDGRFVYTANKTNKTETIKLIPQAEEIVNKYKGKHNKLFPFFIWKPAKGKSDFENDRARLKHKEVCTTVVNKHLKTLAVMAGISKPLSSHIARHTFARMAIDKINNPMITMELLGHSSLAVHQAYLNDIRKDDVLDAAADDIFS